MLKTIYTLLLTVIVSFTALADNTRQLNPDEATTSHHSTVIKGKKVKYSATVGTQPEIGRASCRERVYAPV